MYNSKSQRNNARLLRSNMTDAEVYLWSKLRYQQLGGHISRRQVAIGNHIVDFACLKQHLLIEVDGGQHHEAAHKDGDNRRDAWLSAEGYRVLRFWNHEVLADIDRVLEVIWRELSSPWVPPPQPSPQGGGSFS